MKRKEHDEVVLTLQKQVEELKAERTQLKIKLLHQQQIITKIMPEVKSYSIIKTRDYTNRNHQIINDIYQRNNNTKKPNEQTRNQGIFQQPLTLPIISSEPKLQTQEQIKNSHRFLEQDFNKQPNSPKINNRVVIGLEHFNQNT